MTDPSILRRGVVEGQIENLPSGVNASSSKGSVYIKKTNGCLERSDDRPVLIIQPEQISEDVEYWGKHALICKFFRSSAFSPYVGIMGTSNLESKRRYGNSFGSQQLFYGYFLKYDWQE